MERVKIVHPNNLGDTDYADFYDRHFRRQIEAAIDGLSQKTGRAVIAEVERLHGNSSEVLLKVIVQHRVNDIRMHLQVHALDISGAQHLARWVDDTVRSFYRLAEMSFRASDELAVNPDCRVKRVSANAEIDFCTRVAHEIKKVFDLRTGANFVPRPAHHSDYDAEWYLIRVRVEEVGIGKDGHLETIEHRADLPIDLSMLDDAEYFLALIFQIVYRLCESSIYLRKRWLSKHLGATYMPPIYLDEL